MVCTKSAKMLLRDDVTACVQGVVDALHGLHGKGSKEPITALREMHVHLSQSVIRDMISKEDRQKHAGASRAHRDGSSGRAVPPHANVKAQFKAFANLAAAEFEKVLEWNPVHAVFPTHLLEQTHFEEMLRDKAPGLYAFLLPLLTQSTYKAHTGKKRPLEVQKRMALRAQSVLDWAHIHSKQLATPYARFQTRVAQANKVSRAHINMTTAARRTTSTSSTHEWLNNHNCGVLRELKPYLKGKLAKGHISISVMDNAFTRQKFFYERADRVKGEGTAYVVAGLLEPFTQHTGECNRAPRFVCVGPRGKTRFFGQTISAPVAV